MSKQDISHLEYEQYIQIGDTCNRIVVKSLFLRDTLTGKWEDEKFGFPIIKDQTLMIVTNNRVVKKIQTPIGHKIKSSKNYKRVKVVTFPIINVCLLTSDSQRIYFVYGAEFCNGIDCPEFYGLYNTNGQIIFQGITTEMHKTQINSFKSILNKYKINVNNTDTCTSLGDLWSVRIKLTQ